MFSRLGITILAATLTCSLISCKKTETATDIDTVLERPLNLPATPYNYRNKHLVNSDMATLGRVLFYDVNLSVNNSTSCGSCHKQEFAFANNVQFDKGFNGLALSRNTPSIQGIRGVSPVFDNTGHNFTPTLNSMQRDLVLFWDGRQKNLGNMVLNPVLNRKEMNMVDFDVMAKKLSSLSYYPNLFNKAFGSSDAINTQNIALALEAFIQCLNTDSLVFSTNNALNTAFINQLTNEEKFGQTLFHQKYNCAKCHDPGNGGSYENSASASQMFNIGLDYEYADNGVGALTKEEKQDGVFKVPTLRNISLTAPYMHDGRFKTLDEVLEHYSENIKLHRNLSEQFRNMDGSLKTLNISFVEKKAIIAFLNKLVDKDFITNPMYSDPFQK